VLITVIRTAVTTDRITTETIATECLDRMIANAVREYSRYNPVVASTKISTIADEEEYDLSALNCLWVLECDWWASGQLFAEMRAGAEQMYLLNRTSRYHMPSDRVIDNINQSAHIRATKGTWVQRNKTLIIFPTPASAGDDDLEIVYAALHVLNTAEDGYDTLPDEDLDIIADLTTAVYLQARMNESALEADYAEGLQKLTAHFIPGNLLATTQRLHRGVEGKYGGSGIAIAR